MKILILNAGSSSLKYQLIDMEGEKPRPRASASAWHRGQQAEECVNNENYERTAP